MKVTLVFTALDIYAKPDTGNSWRNECVNTKPCFVFSQQEPGANSTEIMNGINHVRPGNGFQPNFQMFVKIDVNGDKEHALFTYLKVC